MWLNFLRHWNGQSFFLVDRLTSELDLSLYADASGAYGYGDYYQGQWFRGDWILDKRSGVDKGISVAYKELFSIVLAASIRGHRLQ